MFCLNCGNELRTTEREGVIHTSGKYACYPEVKPNDSRWTLVATEGSYHEEFSEDDHSKHDHAEFVFGTVCLV